MATIIVHKWGSQTWVKTTWTLLTYTVYPFLYNLRRLGLHRCSLAILLNKTKICELPILSRLCLSSISSLNSVGEFLGVNNLCSGNINNKKHRYIVDSRGGWCMLLYQFLPFIKNCSFYPWIMSFSLSSLNTSSTSDVSMCNSLLPLFFSMIVNLFIAMVNLIAMATICKLGFYLENSLSFLGPDYPPNKNKVSPQYFSFLEIWIISVSSSVHIRHEKRKWCIVYRFFLFWADTLVRHGHFIAKQVTI